MKWVGKAETTLTLTLIFGKASYKWKGTPNSQLLPAKTLDHTSRGPIFKAPTHRISPQNTQLCKLTGFATMRPTGLQQTNKQFLNGTGTTPLPLQIYSVQREQQKCSFPVSIFLLLPQVLAFNQPAPRCYLQPSPLGH